MPDCFSYTVPIYTRRCKLFIYLNSDMSARRISMCRYNISSDLSPWIPKMWWNDTVSWWIWWTRMWYETVISDLLDEWCYYKLNEPGFHSHAFPFNLHLRTSCSKTFHLDNRLITCLPGNRQYLKESTCTHGPVSYNLLWILCFEQGNAEQGT